MSHSRPNLLFIINPSSGHNSVDWKQEIETFFADKPVAIEFFELPDPCDKKKIKQAIEAKNPERVIAVGGDGTVKLVAECIYNTPMILGILPAGSANGMAKEFEINANPQAAIQMLMDGEVRKIHLVKVNDEICIHLSDVGFNAFVVKKFQEQNRRGMWGYVKAAWKVLWQHSKMRVEISMGEKELMLDASMVVIANATRYGNGVVINPSGSLFDSLFEVVIIKKISAREILKMRFGKSNFDHAKTAIYQTRELKLTARSRVHFQVDGEYRGKVGKLKAEILPGALKMVVPIAT